MFTIDTRPSYSDNLYSDIQPSYKDSLMHHGIKGQKWGVRRFQNTDGSLTALGRERYSSSGQFKSMDRIDKYDLKTAASKAGIKLSRNTHVSINSLENDPNFDKKTGLLKKSSKLTAEQDSEMVNPRANSAGFLDPNRGYYVNCTHCTVAYDLRRRGYDVAASSASGAGETGDVVKQFYKNAKYNNTEPVIKSKNYMDPFAEKFDEKQFQECWKESLDRMWKDPKGYSTACKESGKRVLKACEDFGPNARGNVCIRLAGGGGHSLAFENDSKGRTKFVDTQTLSVPAYKSISSGGKDSAYYKRVLENTDPFFNARVYRYDNATPNFDYLTKNNIVQNPKQVTVTDKRGNQKSFKMYQYNN